LDENIQAWWLLASYFPQHSREQLSRGRVLAAARTGRTNTKARANIDNWSFLKEWQAHPQVSPYYTSEYPRLVAGFHSGLEVDGLEVALGNLLLTFSHQPMTIPPI